MVDDNEANRALAKATLEDEGHRVLLAKGGAEGLAAFEREHPDCVLMDVRMPDIDGFMACKLIRARPDGADVPILFLTALRDIDTFDQAQRSGGDDFLAKPVSPAELVARVQSALRLKGLRVEVRGHYALLKQQRDDLMRLQLQKERLVAFLVHDLKNPVNSIDLHAQVLLRNQSLSESARDSVSRIRADTHQLSRMLLNLLDMSKADEGKLAPRRSIVDLKGLVDDLLVEFAISAQGRRVRLECHLGPARLDADEDLLRRAIANLLENAIRHAPRDSKVQVSTRDREGHLEIRVADSGAGVPPAQRERIFEPFIQDAGDNRLGGRGLGLAFCRLAAEAHSGKIWVEDAGPGAVFCMSLPHGS